MQINKMAEAEIAQLTKQVQELTEELIAAEQKALKVVKKQTTPKPSSTTQETQKIVVLPRERGLKRFTGRRTDGEQPVEDFIEDLKATILAREITPGEKFDLIKSHLEGPARDELRLSWRKMTAKILTASKRSSSKPLETRGPSYRF